MMQNHIYCNKIHSEITKTNEIRNKSFLTASSGSRNLPDMLEIDPLGPRDPNAELISASWSTCIVLGLGRPGGLLALLARNFGTGLALTGSGIRRPYIEKKKGFLH